ncbi:MAG: hypothetical protein R2712_18820 [Vicinamibacterales bacterium]
MGSTPKEGLIALVGAHLAGVAGLLLAPGPWRERLGRLDAAVLGSVAALLLAAPHWVLFLQTLSHSFTLYDTPQAQFASWPHLVAYALGGAAPGQPMTGVVPIALLMTAVAVLHPGRLRRSGIGLGAAICVAAMALVAFGAIPATLLLRLPLVGNIHQVSLTFLGATVAPLLVVAGVGLAAATREVGAGTPLRTVVAISAGTVLLTMLVPGGPWSAAGLLATAVVFASALAMLAIGVLVANPTASAVLATGAALSAAVFTGGLQIETGVPAMDAVLIQPRPRADLDARSPALRALPPDAPEPYRVAPIEAVMFPGTQAYWGIESVGGPDALRLPAIESLSDAAGVERTAWGWWTVLHTDALARVAPYLDMLNVRYLVARPDQAPAGQPMLSLNAPDLVRVVERPSAWPRAFAVAGVGEHRGVTEFARRLQESSGPFASVDAQDPSAVAAVRGLPRTGAVTPAHRYALTPNSTSFDVETTGSGVAVLAEGYVEDAFDVTLNGQNVAYFRVNHALKGIRIPSAGTWHVVFTYRPNGWATTWLVSVLGMTGVATLVLASTLLRLSVNRH